MDGVFSGVATANIERFFGSMIAYDVAMPHTSTRISPINFQTFLVRNNILCLNQEQVYDAANKFWTRYNNMTPGFLEKCQGKLSMNMCEESCPGWNKMVDYLNRVLKVQEFGDHLYYKMHYLAHVCYLFSHETFEDTNAGNCQKALFNNLMSCMFYEHLIPCNNLTFAQVINFADVRFSEAVVMTCARISQFIEAHCARTMNLKDFDLSRLMALKQIVKDSLTQIYEHKYDDDSWKAGFIKCMVESSLIKSDVDVCELHESFERDGMKCCKVLKKLMQARNLFDKNAFDGDPDGAGDYLLDAYAIINKGLESYNVGTDKKKVQEPHE